jgi:sulfide:quinone oxidoreductase
MAERVRILVAGSGPGALEATLALSRSEQLDAEISLISPQTEYLYRPNLVMEPFGVVSTARYSVGEIIRHPSVQQWQGLIERVDPAAGKAWSPENDEFDFDAMVVATGTRPRIELPAPAITIGAPDWKEDVAQVVAEIDAGEISNVIFTRPAGAAYSLPMYELALMAADRASRQSQRQITIAVVTPERIPLELFGAENSERVAKLCAQSGVLVRTANEAAVYDGTTLTLADGETFAAGRVIAVPGLDPIVPEGLPAGAGGFIEVDEHQLVTGTTNIYAVGDVTDFPLKQGGLASEAADAAAAAIEAQLGSRETAEPFTGETQGILLTTQTRLMMRARITKDGSTSLPIDQPSGPVQKIASRLLAERLQELETR